MRIYILLIGILLCISGKEALAQIKFEQEFRVDAEEIPRLALSFIDSCQFDKKIKWYQETSNDGASIEAKTRMVENRNRISIEFDTLGNIQDIEITIPFQEIPDEVRQHIQKQLKSRFKKYRIAKVQAQGVGSRAYLLSIIRKKREIENRNYELIVNGRKEKKYVSYEFLFSGEGKLIRESEIVQQKTDHLDY